MTNKFINGNYINREYSWLQFNERVLDQALDETNPLLERVKFLSIFTSNLDEFFMVRVGSLYNQSVVSPSAKENKTKLTAEKQIDGILQIAKRLYKRKKEVAAALKKELKEAAGIKLIRAGQMSSAQRLEAGRFFTARVMPYLSPMVLDSKHPMIRFESMHLYFVYVLKKGDREMFGVLPVPTRLNRLYAFETGGKTTLMTIEDMIGAFGTLAFPGYEPTEGAMIRVTRNADFETNESDVDSEYDYDFAKYMRDKIASRASLNVVRLEMDNAADKVRAFLLKNLNIKKSQCFVVDDWFDYKFLFKLGDYVTPELAPNLKFAPFKGLKRVYPSLIERVLSRDLFLAYPFDSMETLIELLEECATDKRVTAIRITIYRLDDRSRVAAALKRAAENGVDVTVVIELCARFDEENNMYYAQELADAGCSVIYGMGNYKVHSKIISIVLNDGGEVRYITHLGTGNYNEGTSKQYTDLNIITADNRIGEDGTAFFRALSVASKEFGCNSLLVAPVTLKKGLIACMDREIEKARAGLDAEIVAKMNSLTDKDMIDKLIEASCAGVRVRLVVRGICCLLPGREETANIRVVSIVGRFLEHSRIYSFGVGVERVLYISSADLMTRNTNKRVELATPVLDEGIRDKIYAMLEVMLADNVKGRELHADGCYYPIDVGDEKINSQETFLKTIAHS